ncbi:MAG: hypothetical protein AB1478_06885 [Nitrospirota bacterium]
MADGVGRFSHDPWAISPSPFQRKRILSEQKDLFKEDKMPKIPIYESQFHHILQKIKLERYQRKQAIKFIEAFNEKPENKDRQIELNEINIQKTIEQLSKKRNGD